MSLKDPERVGRASIVVLAVLVIGAAAIFPRSASSGPKDDATGTVSRAEPAKMARPRIPLPMPANVRPALT
jgi:hypothetical protein